ncbi:MAG: hypothetical protein ACE5GJ_02180 [Gemmatimonadota bacterium]
MSSVPRPTLAILLLAALASVQPAAAQAGPDSSRRLSDEELLQIIDSLEAEYERARTVYRMVRDSIQEAAARSLPSLSRLRIGPLTVRTFPGDEALAEEVVSTVWERDFAPWVSWSPVFGNVELFFQWHSPRRRLPVREASLRPVEARASASRAYVERIVADNLAQMLAQDLGSTPIGAWAKGQIGPTTYTGDLYRRVFTAPSRAVRSCYAGDTVACMTALGLTDEFPALDRLYSPRERQFLVRRTVELFSRLAPTAVSRCLDGNIRACDTAIRARMDAGDRTWILPMPVEARTNLVWFALREGGTDSWGRLLDQPRSSPAEALAAASQLTPEQLVARWRQWLVARQPDTRAGLDGGLLVGLFWAGVFTLLSLRSTRWRLG